jgi:carbamoyl-phosphate synthase large subunit
VVVRPPTSSAAATCEIVYNEQGIREFMDRSAGSPEHPVLIDKFLKDAIEVDVDAISDGSETVIGGIMEHIEEAGIHSGDSACVLPPHSLAEHDRGDQAGTKAMAKELASSA